MQVALLAEKLSLLPDRRASDLQKYKQKNHNGLSVRRTDTLKMNGDLFKKSAFTSPPIESRPQNRLIVSVFNAASFKVNLFIAKKRPLVPTFIHNQPSSYLSMSPHQTRAFTGKPEVWLVGADFTRRRQMVCTCGVKIALLRRRGGAKQEFRRGISD